jgi:hypothetical protein
MKDGKPVFGSKTSTTETPSLFDSHGATAASGELLQAVGVPQAAARRLPGL